MDKLIVPEGDYEAYLFDCDGTIADSMPLHYIAWQKALAEWGCEFDLRRFYAWGGMSVATIVHRLNVEQDLDIPIDAVSARRERLYFELLPQLKARADVVHHIDAQYRRIPLAVVSGNSRESVIRTLSRLNLQEKFQTLVCAGDYKNSKPHPESFLVAAQRLGVSPSHCLVFEDSDFGIEAAGAAGMRSVKVPASGTEVPLGLT